MLLSQVAKSCVVLEASSYPGCVRRRDRSARFPVSSKGCATLKQCSANGASSHHSRFYAAFLGTREGVAIEELQCCPRLYIVMGCGASVRSISESSSGSSSPSSSSVGRKGDCL